MGNISQSLHKTAMIGSKRDKQWKFNQWLSVIFFFVYEQWDHPQPFKFWKGEFTFSLSKAPWAIPLFIQFALFRTFQTKHNPFVYAFENNTQNAIKILKEQMADIVKDLVLNAIKDTNVREEFLLKLHLVALQSLEWPYTIPTSLYQFWLSWLQ